MKVARSCHGAFLGRSARAAVDATSAMPATPAREYADVAVKTDGACVDSSIVVSVSDSGEISGEGWAVGSKSGRKNVTMVSVSLQLRDARLQDPLPPLALPPLLTALCTVVELHAATDYLLLNSIHKCIFLSTATVLHGVLVGACRCFGDISRTT